MLGRSCYPSHAQKPRSQTVHTTDRVAVPYCIRPEKLMKRFHFLAILLAGALLGSCSDTTDPPQGEGPSGPLGQERSASARITPEQGGELTMTTDKGERVVLTVPPGALEEEVEASVTWLGQAPDTLLSEVSFALRFEPSGLVFNMPVRLEISHPTPFAPSEDMTLFYLASERRAWAMSVEPITDKTEAYLTHFSEYVGAKATQNMETLCSESEFPWVDPEQRCIDNWPYVDTLLKCAAWSGTPQAYVEKANSLMAGSFALMRSNPVPKDDYCHRKGSASGRYIEDLQACNMTKDGSEVSAFLDESTVQAVLDGMGEAATELAQAWLDSSPPTGDSCYKLGRVQEWMDYVTCLHSSPLHNLHEPNASADLFPDHGLEGKVVVQKEFLASPRPSSQSELCGWYLDCLEMHVSDSGLTRDLVDEGEVVALDLEQGLAEVRAACQNLWNIEIELDVTHHHLFSGIDEYTADYTVSLGFEDVQVGTESSSMQTAVNAVNELGGIGQGELDTLGESLVPPFFTRLLSGERYIQMSFMLTEKQASRLDIVDKGSSYTCHMGFACEEITDFEVRKRTAGTGMAAPRVQAMLMRSQADSTLTWAGQVLPHNTGYFLWRMENLVEYCEYDSDKGQWSCEKPTMGTVAEPRPGQDSVVNDPSAPTYRFFNAYLTPQQIKNIIDRKAFSYSYDLQNDLGINDGAITETQSHRARVQFSPKE